MSRHYRISPMKKRMQINKAILTRKRRYGARFFSHRGIKKVTNNLIPARRVLKKKWDMIKNV